MRRLGRLVCGVAAVAAACQPGAAATTPAATTPGSTSAPTVAATGASSPAPTRPIALPRPSNLPTDGSCEDENSSCLGIIEANKTYVSKVFKPRVTFALPIAGWMNQHDGGGDFGLQSLTDPGDAIIFFRDPRSTDKSVGPKVDDIAFWLERYQLLDVTPFEPATLGGLEGSVMDIRTAPSATGTDANCPVQVCVEYMRGDDPVLNDPYQWHWDWSTAGSEAARLYLLTDPNGTVAVVIDSVDGTTFDALIATWEKVAPTIKFG